MRLVKSSPNGELTVVTRAVSACRGTPAPLEHNGIREHSPSSAAAAF